MEEKHLQEFKKKNQLTDADIDWEFQQQETPPGRLSFPVSRRHVMIKKAKDCSDLLLRPFSKKSNWVYISPEYDLVLVEFLEKWT